MLAPLQTNGIAPLSTISLGIDDNVSESCKKGNKESSLRTRIKLDEEKISMSSVSSNDLTCFIFGKSGINEILSNSVIFHKKINNIEQVDEKINIHFIDGSSDKVDYLVVSDGVFSNTKSVIENFFFQPDYYGAIAIRTQIRTEDISNLNSNNISLIMGSDAHLVLYPINQKKEFNLVCIIRKKSEDNDSIKTILENTILKENKNLVNLFKGDLKSWPIHTSGKPIKSIYKNVLYIGDAFYTFPPTMAQGASQAIEAANEIFELISNNHKDIQNEYFKNRVERTNLINNRSRLNYFGFHISNPLLKILRNEFLKRLVKNKKFIHSYLGKIYK